MTVSPASGETAIVASGDTEYGQPEVAGQLNLAGQVNATSNLPPATLESGATVTAASTRDRFGWLIPSGETRSVPSGQETFGLPLIAGQLEVSGQLNITEVGTDTAALDSGTTITADGTVVTAAGAANLSAGSTVTANGNKTRFISALLEAGALGTFRRTRLYGKATLESGATTDATATATRKAAAALISGAELTGSGSKFLRAASALLSGGSTITADATAFRTTATKTLEVGATITAERRRTKFAVAALSAGVDLSATTTLSFPLIRGDSANIEWHEDDDIDLGADSDGTQ